VPRHIRLFPPHKVCFLRGLYRQDPNRSNGQQLEPSGPRLRSKYVRTEQDLTKAGEGLASPVLIPLPARATALLDNAAWIIRWMDGRTLGRRTEQQRQKKKNCGHGVTSFPPAHPGRLKAAKGPDAAHISEWRPMQYSKGCRPRVFWSNRRRADAVGISGSRSVVSHERSLEPRQVLLISPLRNEPAL